MLPGKQVVEMTANKERIRRLPDFGRPEWDTTAIALFPTPAQRLCKPCG